MQLTIKIKDSKALAFLNFIKSLDFVIIEEEDKSFTLSDAHKNILKEREASYKKGNSNTSSWEEVKSKARK